MLSLTIPPQKAKQLLIDRVNEIPKIQKNRAGDYEIANSIEWMAVTLTVVAGIYGVDDRHYTQLKNASVPPSGDENVDVHNTIVLYNALLRSCVKEITIYLDTPEFLNSKTKKVNLSDKLEILNNIFDKFHLIATRLANRRPKKEPFLIKDEYDVQDLLHALMTPIFKDIRPEEPTPSFGGNFSKMDFSIADTKMVIEVKIASTMHTGKQIVDELLSDIARYQKSQDCNLLICFIYDPGFSLKEPSSIKIDLEKESMEKFSVEVIIEPKR